MAKSKESEAPTVPEVPSCPEAERGVLGQCFADPLYLQTCINRGLKREKFLNEVHGALWAAIETLGNRGVTATDADMLALAYGELRKRKDDRGLVPMVFITEICKLGWSSKGDFFLNDVLDYANRREAIVHATRLLHRLYEPGSCDEIQSDIMPHVTQLNNMAVVDKDERLSDVARRVRANIKNIAEGKPMEGTTISIGLPVADKLLHGLNSKRDYITILAARPSVGKTALATQIMQSALKQLGEQAVVVDFQLENSRDNHVAQMGSRFAQMDLNRPKEWTAEQKTKFDQYVSRIEEVADKRLYVYEHDTTIEQIEARCRFIKKKHGYISLVVLDYIQLVGTMDHSIRDERKVLNLVSRRLKLLAKEIGCPFLVLAQLSREHEKDGSEPQLKDIKESGNIEADADRVWFLHVPKGAKLVEGCIETWLIQRKNKYGPTGKVTLTHRRTTTTFFVASNATPEEQAAAEDPGAPADIGG